MKEDLYFAKAKNNSRKRIGTLAVLAIIIFVLVLYVFITPEPQEEPSVTPYSITEEEYTSILMQLYLNDENGFMVDEEGNLIPTFNAVANELENIKERLNKLEYETDTISSND